jgi:hypothetical protein
LSGAPYNSGERQKLAETNNVAIATAAAAANSLCHGRDPQCVTTVRNDWYNRRGVELAP